MASAGGLDQQQALAGALMKGAVDGMDPSTIADRKLKMYQIDATIDERAAAREDRAALVREQIALRESMGQSAAELRRELATMTAATARDAEAGRNERGAADRAERDARGAADREARATAKSVAGDDKKQGRLASLEATKAALVRVQTTSDNLDSGGGAIEGRLPAMGVLTQDFDGAKAQLLGAIQTALRVPGIGSQSNMELQALMGALPERTQEQTVRNNQIKGIAERLQIIMAREEMNDGDSPAASPVGQYDDPAEEAAYQAYKRGAAR